MSRDLLDHSYPPYRAAKAHVFSLVSRRRFTAKRSGDIAREMLKLCENPNQLGDTDSERVVSLQRSLANLEFHGLVASYRDDAGNWTVCLGPNAPS